MVALTVTSESSCPLQQIPLLDTDALPVPTVRAASSAEKTFIAGQGAAFTVPFDSLRVGSDNVRDAASDPESIRALAESIRRNGLLSALSVQQSADASPDGGFLIVTAGHRRWLALKALGFYGRDPVPVHVLAGAAASQRTMRMLAENVDRVNLSPLEESRAVDRLHRINEMKVKDVAAAVGWSASKVSQRLALLELPASALAALEAGEIDASAGYQLSRLYRMGHPVTARELLVARAPASVIKTAVDRCRLADRCSAVGAKLAARGFAVTDKAPPGFRLDRVIETPERAEPADYLEGIAVVGRMWPDLIVVWSVRPDGPQEPSGLVTGEIRPSLDRDEAFDLILDVSDAERNQIALDWARSLAERVLEADRPYLNELLNPNENDPIEYAVFDIVRAVAVLEAGFYGP